MATVYNYGRMKQANGRYFGFYSNGGLGHMPIQLDDSVSTDEVSVRSMQYPSFATKQYYGDADNSSYYTHQRSRLNTAMAQFSQLQARGIKIVGADLHGRYKELAASPDPSLLLYQADSQTHTLLLTLVVIGGIILVLNAIAPTD
jgi:hypothetical protein